MTRVAIARRLIHSLYARLALIFLASLLVMSLGTAWIAVSQFNQFGREWLQRTQIHLATHLAERFNDALAQGPNSAAVHAAIDAVERVNPLLSIYVLGLNGKVVGTTKKDLCAVGKAIATAPIGEMLSKMPMLPVYVQLPCQTGKKVFSVAPIHYGAQQTRGYLLVALAAHTHMSMTHMWQTSSIARSLLFAGIGALLLTAIVGLLLFALFTRRFSRLRQAVQRFAAGDHSQRLPVHRDDEVSAAARAFNDMAATIEAQVAALRENDRQRRELVANLSHDFRTPLTALRGYAERLRRHAGAGDAEQLDALLANVERLTRLAEQLSLLSRIDVAERSLHVERFPLDELAQDIVAKFLPKAEALGVTLSIDCCRMMWVNADLELIDRALSNLVENALHATNAGGRVTLAANLKAGRVRVSVVDSGVGIPRAELALVTQRFYRTQKGRQRGTGSGLGLAIVAEVCARHGVRLQLSSNQQGTRACFELPAA